MGELTFSIQYLALGRAHIDWMAATIATAPRNANGSTTTPTKELIKRYCYFAHIARTHKWWFMRCMPTYYLNDCTGPLNHSLAKFRLNETSDTMIDLCNNAACQFIHYYFINLSLFSFERESDGDRHTYKHTKRRWWWHPIRDAHTKRTQRRWEAQEAENEEEQIIIMRLRIYLGRRRWVRIRASAFNEMIEFVMADASHFKNTLRVTTYAVSARKCMCKGTHTDRHRRALNQ